MGQSIVNVPDAKVIRLYVDDEPLHLSTADLLEYERCLDFRTGVLSRHLVWRTPSGKRVRVETRRMVSFTEKHLAVMTFEVTLLDGRGPVQISSQLINRQDRELDHPAVETPSGTIADPRKSERLSRRVMVPEISTVDADSGRIRLGYRCAESKMTIGVAVDHQITADSEVRSSEHIADDEGKMIYRLQMEAGQSFRLTKTVSYHTAQHVPSRELLDRCERTLDRAAEEGTQHQFAEQETWLDDVLGTLRRASCRASPSSSRRCAGTSSRSSRPRHGPRTRASRPRA